MIKKGEGYFELVSKYPIEKLVFPAGWYYTSAEGFTSPILSELSTFGYCQIIVRPGILQKVKSFLEWNPKNDLYLNLDMVIFL